MQTLLLSVAAAAMALGLVLYLVAMRYRTEAYLATPWYKRFHFTIDQSSCFRAPGHLFAHFGMSLMASGALVMLVLSLLK
jgi:hypothetical protein